MIANISKFYLNKWNVSISDERIQELQGIIYDLGVSILALKGVEKIGNSLSRIYTNRIPGIGKLSDYSLKIPFSIITTLACFAISSVSLGNLCILSARCSILFQNVLMNTSPLLAKVCSNALFFGSLYKIYQMGKSAFDAINMGDNSLNNFYHGLWNGKRSPYLTQIETPKEKNDVYQLLGKRNEFNQILKSLSNPKAPLVYLTSQNKERNDILIRNLLKFILIYKNNKIYNFNNYRVFTLNYDELINSSMSDVMLQNTLNSLGKEDILVIDDLSQLLNFKGFTSETKKILMDAFSNQSFPCLIAESSENITASRESGLDFLSPFSRVHLQTLDEGETRKQLLSQMEILEDVFGRKFTEESLRRAVSLSSKSLLPEKALEILYKAAVRKEKGGVVDTPDIEAVLMNEVEGIKKPLPPQKIEEDLKINLLEIEEKIKKKVVGQDQAIHSICEQLQIHGAGINGSSGVIGSFLFVGTPGVGKTHLASVIAEEVFGSSDSLVRINLSEFVEKHAIARLIGVPPGYMGHDAGGQLTEKVKKYPRSVVLFDEIEKAAPEVANILLQILQDGYTNDSKGDKIDFSKTIVLVTANRIGSLLPELKDRFHHVIEFNPLNKEALSKILDMKIHHLKERLDKQQFTLKIEPDLYEFLLDELSRGVQGARALNRLFTKYVEAPAAKQVLKHRESGSGPLDIELKK